jgi:hypothetical protein
MRLGPLARIALEGAEHQRDEHINVKVHLIFHLYHATLPLCGPATLLLQTSGLIR